MSMVRLRGNILTSNIVQVPQKQLDSLKTWASIWKLECSLQKVSVRHVLQKPPWKLDSFGTERFLLLTDLQVGDQSEFPFHWNCNSKYNKTSAIVLFPLPAPISSSLWPVICIMLTFRSPRVALRKKGRPLAVYIDIQYITHSVILVIQAIWLVSYLGLWRYIHRARRWI